MTSSSLHIQSWTNTAYRTQNPHHASPLGCANLHSRYLGCSLHPQRSSRTATHPHWCSWCNHGGSIGCIYVGSSARSSVVDRAPSLQEQMDALINGELPQSYIDQSSAFHPCYLSFEARDKALVVEVSRILKCGAKTPTRIVDNTTSQYKFKFKLILLGYPINWPTRIGQLA